MPMEDLTTPEQRKQGITHHSYRSAFLPEASDFTDLTIKLPPDDPKRPYPIRPQGNWEVCPRCLGYGGWNLELNAYGPGKHFRASCAQCNGWGHVDTHDRRDVECIHRFTERDDQFLTLVGRKPFHCEHVWVCMNGCGRWRVIDSSD